MSENINVVVVDSGVYSDHPQLKEYGFSGVSICQNDEDILVIDDDISDNYGHGTAVVTIIKKVDPIANIQIIKIIDKMADEISEAVLLETLNYIASNVEVDVLNLSLGINICENPGALYNACQRIIDKGAIIVSAFDNSGALSYPALFDNVIGVISGKNCLKIDSFEYVDDSMVNVLANGNMQKLAWSSPPYIMMGGNSFACAHVTAQIVKFLKEGKSNCGILNGFKEISGKSHKFPEQLYSNPSKNELNIKNAALFPFNKEMHSLIRFQDSTICTIKGVYDIKYSPNIGIRTSRLLRISDLENDFTVKNISDIIGTRLTL